MSLVDYFQTPFAYNPLTNTLVTDATFTVHLPTDPGFANPLTVTEASSGAAIPVLRSNSVGALPEFAVAGQPPQVILRSGSFTTMLTSMFGAVIAAGLDASTVQKAIAAGVDAEAARKAAVEAKAGAESARKAAEAVGTTTDDIVSTQIQAPGTKTRTALLGAVDTVSGPYSASRDRQRMADLGAADRLRSAGLASQALQDCQVGEIVKDWADLTGWTPGNPNGLQVSNNRLYPGSANGAASGLVYPISLSSTETFRAVVLVFPKASDATDSGGIIVGVSSGAAGAAPATAASARGLYFRQGQAKQFTDGNTGSDLGAIRTDTGYAVTITVDENWVSVVAVALDGNPKEFRYRTARAGFTVNNIFLFNSLTSGTSGGYIGPVAAHKALSSFRPRTAVLSSASENFAEPWSGLTQWTVGGANGVQVSGGYLYGGTSAGGGVSGLVHATPIGFAGTLSMATTFRKVSGSGGIILGYSSGAPGAAPSAGGAQARGFYISGTDIRKWERGAATTVGTIRLGVEYNVVLDVRATTVVLTVTASDNSAETWTVTFSRADQPVNNIYLMNSDTGGTSGSRVGAMTATWSVVITETNPHTQIEGVARSAHWSQTAAGSNFKVLLPRGYDSRVPSPLAICFHGNGSDEHLYTDNIDSNATRVATKLLAAGYIVLTAAYTPGTSTWGAQGSLDAYYDAYRYVRDHYAIGPVVLHADSMGGIESLLTIAENRIPGIVAWFGSVPTANLAANYANSAFTATIKAAYGIASDGSNYAQKTAGHDPALMPGHAFRGLPMAFYASTDDTTVPKAQNTDVLAPIVAPFAAQLVVPSGITGGHGAAGAFPEQVIADFFDKYTKG